MTTGTPPAEISVDENLVADLIAAQCPQHAGEEISLLDSGWDNTLYRVGRSLIARLPRREVAVQLLEHERDWLPLIASRLDIATPAAVFAGEPSSRFPYPWLIVPWIEGQSANLSPPASSEVERLAGILRSLHQPAPSDAPINPFRAVPLAERTPSFEDRLMQLAEHFEAETLETLRVAFQASTLTPPPDQKVWIHGDLHARNVLVQNGRLSGIIDWGDLTAGDPATDLAGVWSLFASANDRRRFWTTYAASPDLITRARGWAILVGSTLLLTGLQDHPEHEQMGRAILDRVTRDVENQRDV